MPANIFSVRENNVLITGASSGIGRHCAKFLAKNGANVILVGRDSARLQTTEQECQQLGVKALSIVADVQDEQQVADIFRKCQQHFDHLDTVINSAGVAARKSSQELSIAEWDKIFNINVRGTFLVSKFAAKWMIAKQTSGKIINISSCAAFHHTKIRMAYSASKIAVESITRNFALELTEHNIRVNCIAPGYFVTSINKDYLLTDDGKKEIAKIPMQRAAQLEEMEGVILLLASKASSYMTGSVINIDGGYAINKT